MEADRETNFEEYIRRVLVYQEEDDDMPELVTIDDDFHEFPKNTIKQRES